MQQDSVFVTTWPDGIRRPSSGIKVLLFMVPFMFMVLGLALGFVSYSFVSSAATAPARVVSHVAMADGALTPLLEFEVEGLVVSVALGVAMAPESLPAGSRVDILYNPELPAHVRLSGLTYNYGFAAMVIGIGAVLFVIAWLGWMILTRRIARHIPAER